VEDNDTEISQKEAKKKGVRIALGMTALGLSIALLGGWYFYAADHGARSGKTQVRIEKNATGGDIASLLEKQGVIESAVRFRLYARLLGEGNQLQSGNYVLEKGLTIREAIDALKHGKTEAALVTVPEGSTVHQIAQLLAQAGIEGAADFEVEAATYGPLKFQYGPVAVPIKAEGFLFADTYSRGLRSDAPCTPWGCCTCLQKGILLP